MSRSARLLSLLALVILASSLSVTPVRAQAVAKSDPRALAMGGGYVAVADGYSALQWNPAGMWVSGRREVAIALGNIPFEGGSWIESLRVAGGFSDALEPVEAAAILASPDAGLAGEQVLGAYFVSTRFGGAFQQITYVNELTRLADGEVVIDMAALRTREYQFSAAHPFAQGRFIIGGSAKVVQAQGRLRDVPLDTLGPGELSSGALLSRARSGPEVSDDTVFSVDVGVLLIPAPKFRLGAVVKNLNAPGLGTDDGAITRLPRQIRVGGLLLPHPSLRLTLDFDLTNDVFVLDGRKRRELGGGVEWATDNVALRGGLLFDMGAVERRPTYTFGVGLGGETVRADLAGSWAPDRDGFGWLGALAADF